MMHTTRNHWFVFAFTFCGLLLAPLFLVRTPAQGEPPAKGATYVGATLCKACHAQQTEALQPSPHGKTATADGVPASMKGCEACHGPGSQHLPAGAKLKLAVPKADDVSGNAAVCGACHFTAPNSAAPAAWQKLSGQGYLRSAHGKKGVACLACHSGHPNGKAHALRADDDKLCLTCHGAVLEAAPGKTADFIHTPVKDGQCTLCHDPHGLENGNLVVKNIGDVCRTCHAGDDAAMTKAHLGYDLSKSTCVSCHDAHSHDKEHALLRKSRHMPFQAGKCQVCHAASADGKPAGLVKPAKELCLTCHPAAKLMPDGEKAHAPVKAGLCLSCHNPHVSEQKALLKDTTGNLCTTCHKKIDKAMNEPHKHKVLENTRNCSLCHDGHSSKQDHLLVKDEMTLCGQCHKHTFSHPMGTRKDGKPVLDPKTKKTLVCSSCHVTHGSTFQYMTLGNSNRELCLKCHDVNH